jgi:hypothetical protein
LGDREGNVRRFWKRDDELHRLEAELRASRPEPPRGFIRALVESQRSEDRWLRPKVRVGLAVVLAGLALAALASAGGFGVIAHTTKAAVKVMQRTTHRSSRLTVFSSAANKQYQKHCGGAAEDKCHITIFDSSVKEPRNGTTTTTFTVSLDAYNDAPVTVTYHTSGGNPGACSPSSAFDYEPQTSTLTFPIGSPSQTITITICADTSPSGTSQETFHVNLDVVSTNNATIVRTPATGTIST